MNRPAEKRPDKNRQKPTKKTNCLTFIILNLYLFLPSFHDSFHVLTQKWTVTWNEDQKSLSFHLSFHVLIEKWTPTWNQPANLALKHHHTKKRAGPPKEAGPHKAVWNGQDNRLPYSEKQFSVCRERPVLSCGLKLELVAVCTERVHCRDHFILDLVCKYFVIIDRI